jgi:integration host factor subunit alpha
MILRSMPLTKPQLAAMLLYQLGINEREAEGLVESFYEEISLTLEFGESVSLSGFGRFEKDAFTPGVALTRAVK